MNAITITFGEDERTFFTDPGVSYLADISTDVLVLDARVPLQLKFDPPLMCGTQRIEGIAAQADGEAVVVVAQLPHQRAGGALRPDEADALADQLRAAAAAARTAGQ